MKLNLGILSLFLILAACQPKSNSSGGPEANYYNPSEVQTMSNDTGKQLGVPVRLENSKDFAKEYNYKRIINLLNKHADRIRPHLQGVESILVGNSGSGISDNNQGQLVVMVSVDMDETSLLDLFEKGLPRSQNRMAFAREISQKIGIAVVDEYGVTTENIQALSDKIREIARSIEFSQDKTFKKIILSNFFGLMSDGMAIDVNASAGEIRNHLLVGLDSRIRWNVEVLPLLQKIDLSLTYQPGTFTGLELREVIDSVKKEAVTIKSLVSRFKLIYVGKRWDTDYNSGILLYDFHTTGADLRGRLTDLNPNVSEIEMAQARTALESVFERRGYRFASIQINLPPENSSLALVSDFNVKVAAKIDAELFRKLGIRTLSLIRNDRTAYVLSSQTLYVSLPASLEEVSSTLQFEVLRSEFSASRSVIVDHSRKLGVELDLAGDRLQASPTVNAFLSAFAAWYPVELTSELRSSSKLQKLVLFLDPTKANPSTFKSGVLSVNLADFDPKKVKDLLSVTN